jgi:hypothetical protein
MPHHYTRTMRWPLCCCSCCLGRCLLCLL